MVKISKIIPPIWCCDPDTCEPERDRVKLLHISYQLSVCDPTSQNMSACLNDDHTFIVFCVIVIFLVTCMLL